MKRMFSAARCDVELQARYGLYAATVLVLVISVAALASLPASGLVRLLPAVALNTLGITAFYFSIALALLERAEGSELARRVSPLRPREYLAARVATLALLGLVQQLAFGVTLLGIVPELLLLAFGTSLAAAILVLAGIVVAAGHHSISDLLLPSVSWLGLLLAPLVADVLEWHSPLLWLHPLNGPLTLMRAAVDSVPAWELTLALVSSLGWTVVAFGIALRRR